MLGLLAASRSEAQHSEELARLHGTVMRVVDGDTIDVELASGPIRVRLHAVDTPERGQPWGDKATQALLNLVLHKQVDLEPIEQDRYDRLVARVFLNTLDVNGELIARGHAWAYSRYMQIADVAYCDFEADARAERRGLWSLGPAKNVAPWEWRAWRRAGAKEIATVERTQTACVASIGAR